MLLFSLISLCLSVAYRCSLYRISFSAACVRCRASLFDNNVGYNSLPFVPFQCANNESSEVIDPIDILLPETFYFTLRPRLMMSKTSDDSLFASRVRYALP